MPRKQEVLVMDEKINVYQTMLKLAQTTLEGVEYIQERTLMGCFGDTAALFTDVADSLHEMKKALTCYYPDYEESALSLLEKDVISGMQMMLLAYEGDKEVRPLVVLQFSLVPGFRRWHDALQDELHSLCVGAMN